MVRSAETTSDGFEVKVAVLGGEVKPVFLTPGSTVEDALNAAGVDTGSTVKCGGSEVALVDEVESGDLLVVTSKVKGGL